VRRCALLFALIALAGCGGGTKTPAGYRTYVGHGVSFAYPPGWETRNVENGVDLVPPGAAKRSLELIRMRVLPWAYSDVDEYLDEDRARSKRYDAFSKQHAPSTEIKRDEDDIDVRGAQAGHRFDVKTKQDGVEWTTAIVDAFRDDAAVVSLNVNVKRSTGVDVDGVVESFALTR